MPPAVRGLLVAALSALAVSGPSARQRAPEGVSERLRALVAGGRVPSIAVAVARDGRLLWSDAAGLADKQRRIPATPSTPYSVASVTKPFTATALMALAERDMVDLDAPVSRYLGPLGRPGVSDASQVTLRRVLGHVGGFPQHYQFFYDDRPARPLPLAERLRCFGAEVAPPGARHVYSNLGYGVLGEVIAKASEASYANAMAREVFEPLGLRSASVPDDASAADRAAVRYGTDGEPLPFYVTDHAAASELYIGVEDLARFGLYHAGALLPARQVLSRAAREAMQRPGLAGRGLGWAVNADWHGRTVAWHSGAMPGSSATLWVVPSERIAIAVVSNQFGAPVNQLAGGILAGLLGVEPPTARGGPSEPDEAPSAPGTPRPDPIGRWRGAVAGCPDDLPLALDIRARGDVTVTAGARPPQPAGSPMAAAGRASGTFLADGDPGQSLYRFDLQARGDLLEGPVSRATSLGPRGGTSVTLWARLEREKQAVTGARRLAR